jgi:hypothetical protein
VYVGVVSEAGQQDHWLAGAAPIKHFQFQLVDRNRHRDALLRAAAGTGCDLRAALPRSGVHVCPGLLLPGWRAVGLACGFLVAAALRRSLLGRAPLLRESLLSGLLGTPGTALGSR